MSVRKHKALKMCRSLDREVECDYAPDMTLTGLRFKGPQSKVGNMNKGESADMVCDFKSFSPSTSCHDVARRWRIYVAKVLYHGQTHAMTCCGGDSHWTVCM